MDTKTIAWFEENGLTPPSRAEHGTEADVRSQMQPLKMWDWRLEGNQLHCQTDMGPFMQTIPTNLVLTGMNENNLPILVKVKI